MKTYGIKEEEKHVYFEYLDQTLSAMIKNRV